MHSTRQTKTNASNPIMACEETKETLHPSCSLSLSHCFCLWRACVCFGDSFMAAGFSRLFVWCSVICSFVPWDFLLRSHDKHLIVGVYVLRTEIPMDSVFSPWTINCCWFCCVAVLFSLEISLMAEAENGFVLWDFSRLEMISHFAFVRVSESIHTN